MRGFFAAHHTIVTLVTSKKSFDQSRIHLFVFYCSPGVPILCIVTPYDTVPEVTLMHQHIQMNLLIHLPVLSPHSSRSDESDSSVLAESGLDVTHTLLSYMFAKFLVIPKLPMME